MVDSRSCDGAQKSWKRRYLRSWTRIAHGDVPPHAGALDEAFTKIWDGATPGQRLPLLLLNGTHADSGLPILTAPVKVTRDQFQLSLDLLDLTGRDMHVSTAVSNSARFPVVTPGGTLTNHYRVICKPAENTCDPGPRYGGYVMDGGYIRISVPTPSGISLRTSTSGAICATRIVKKEAERTGKKANPFVPHVLVIQVSSDPTASLAEIPRCGTSDDKVLKPRSLEKPSQALSDILGPLAQSSTPAAPAARGPPGI